MGKSDKSELTLAELELLLRDQVVRLEQWIADADGMLIEVSRLLLVLKTVLKPSNESND
jgi:hypothetical protein